MKKIAKLSLVAAVAVAGLTNVNAASLEEAIKGVDVSGQFRFRVQDENNTTTGTNVGTNKNSTDVEIEIGAKVPVTEQVTAVFKIDNENDDNDDVTKGEVKIEDYYFSYADSGLTVNFGQQNIPGRITDGAQGDGIVALYNLGVATVGAAAFMTNSLTEGDDVYSVIAMGNAGPVSLLAQYANIPDVMDTVNVKADVSVDMIKAGVEYTESDLDGSSAERETTKVYVSANAGIVSAKLSYAGTGKDGSGSIGQESEAASEYLLWNVGTFGKADLDLFAIDATVKLTDKVSLRAAYADGEYTTANTDINEVLGQVSYKVAKNLSTYVRYAQVEDGANEKDRGRVEVKYSF
jgi:hypothetical protein